MTINKTDSGIILDRRQLVLGASMVGLSAAFGSVPAMAAGAPKKGGTLRIGMEGGSASDSLDPRTYADSIAAAISLMLWNGLVEVADDGEATGELFENWEVKPGAAEWLFNVRKGITFTSGKTLDADDVIYSLNLHRGETKSAAKATLDEISDIKKVNANQVKILLNNGNLDLPFNLGLFNVIVVPNGFTDWSKPDGTGAYTLEEFQPGVRATFNRKAGNYWKPNRGNFDRVELLYIGDAAARTQALVTGQVDVINRVDPRTAALLAKNKNVRLSRTPGMGNRYCFDAQTDKDPYANKDLMLALKYGIDRKKIVDNVFSGYASMGNDHNVGPKMKYYDTKQKQIAYDPDKARFHYKKSGITAPIELKVSEGAFSGATDSGLIYQESLNKAGIELDLKRVSADGYWDNVWLKVPFCAVFWGNRPTIDSQLTTTFFGGLKNPWNDTHFENAEFSKTLLAARTELDQKKRGEMYARCQELIAQNSGMVCFAVQDYLDACNTKLQGLTPSGRYDMADLRIAEKGWFA
ncbi:ABC transporter substrate-binding protein [Mesorhizobium sp.]|uniref:ABC transporter substrate-binding protein n=1 Tax=Mesorhizobium sp. TaxID=1871066 RepID=UPI000FE8C39A|nr:ABC transporter substrate-binding protein [Mesorhizobium sp.]RWA97318.1 MAG: ABC transporter substrate-binding protein [Mesorhizobium sp.]